ncbi:unnamed protein product [Ectocarpus sp. 4 AP-2014]
MAFSFGKLTAAPAPSLFGTAPAAAAQATTTPGFGGFGLGAASTQQQQQQAVGAAPTAANAGSASQKEFEKLFEAYAAKNPANGEPNPSCRMKHVVYNQVDPSLRNSYTRPPHMDDKTWKKAEEDNPDPSKLAPAAVIGWESLKERLVGQQQEMKKMAEFVALMHNTTRGGLRSVALVRTQMEASRRRHLAQAHRFLKLQRKLDAVRCLNKPLSDDERQLRTRLEGVHRSLGPPQQTLKDLNSALLQGERHMEEVEEITDPEELRRIFQALEGQREGLTHLMRIVKKDRQDLEIMKKSRELVLTQ